MTGETAYDEQTYLEHLEHGEMVIDVGIAGGHGHFSIGVPGLGHFELGPHEFEEWLVQHGFKPKHEQPRIGDAEAAFARAIERGRAAAAAPAEPHAGLGASADPRVVELAGQLQQHADWCKALATGTDHTQICTYIRMALAAVHSAELHVNGDKAGDAQTEVDEWARREGDANVWTLESLQAAANGIGHGVESAGWHLRNGRGPGDDETRQVLHQLIESSAGWRGSLQPVQTWDTGGA